MRRGTGRRGISLSFHFRRAYSVAIVLVLRASAPPIPGNAVYRSRENPALSTDGESRWQLRDHLSTLFIMLRVKWRKISSEMKSLSLKIVRGSVDTYRICLTNGYTKIADL